jgi:hypothetical protein
MSAGVPEEKAVDFFNKVSDLRLEDVDAARDLADQLLMLNRQHPGDVITKLALAEALLLCSRRDEAIDQIGGAFSLRFNAPYAALDKLAVLFFFVSYIDKAIAVVEEYAFKPDLLAEGLHEDNSAQIAAWAADFDLLRRLTHRHRRDAQDDIASFFLDDLERFGHHDLFVRHQRVVADVMKDVQLAAGLSAVTDADGHYILINTLFFDPSKTARRELETRLEGEISAKIGNGLEGLVANVVTASPARPKMRSPFLRSVD